MTPSIRYLLPLLLCLFAPAAWAQTGVVLGTVTDAATNEPIPGVNVGVVGTAFGAATDADGQYRLVGLPAGTHTLAFSFVGYAGAERTVTLAPSGQEVVDVALEEAAIGLGDLVVTTASRREEKVLDAPASVSVLEAEEILQESVAPNAVQVLRNTTGVDMAQTGAARQEVVLRGFNNAFSGATYVLTDYRQAAVPSLGVNVFSIMPNLPIDLERVEVVRGPGSALYGAGVDAGVIHFISKSPFEHPGTTVAVSGGERAFLGVQARHAGVIGQNVGYKITGDYARVDDWELDPDDPLDADQLADDAIARDYEFQKVNVNGTLEYRFDPQTTLTATAGYSEFTGIVLSGIGTLQGDGFGYTYGQLRLQSGSFFAQAYFNRNSAGDSFVYDAAFSPGQPYFVIDNGILFNAQTQYDLAVGQRGNVIVGLDAELSRPDTDGTILGRNEGDDAINEYGAYAQGTFAVSEMLDVTAALRADYNNIVEETQLSPRAALVFKPNAENTLRATFNRAFSSPGTNSNFLDIPARVTNFPGDLRFVLQGRGAAEGYTFETFRQTGTARAFLPVPGFFGQDIPIATVPIAPVFAAAVGAPGSDGVLDFLLSPAPLPAPLPSLTSQQRQLLGQLAGYVAQSGALGSAVSQQGVLGIPDGSGLGYRPVEGPVDIEPLAQTTTQTFELGYRGVLGRRLLLSADGYYTRKEDFIGPLAVETPLLYLDNAGNAFAGEVGLGLGQAFASGDPTIAAILQQLAQSGLPPQQVGQIAAQVLGGLIGGAVGGGFGEAIPIAVVQADQPALPGTDPTAVGGFLTYRNFGQVEFWGADFGAELLVNDEMSVFGNVSFVSDDFFDNEELEETNTSLEVALNAPSLKAKGGFRYGFGGAYVSSSGRYTEGFPVRSGPYVGDVESYFLLDVGAGYDFARYAPGLRADLQLLNVLDNEHREFVGAPEIGRMAMLRLTYAL